MAYSPSAPGVGLARSHLAQVEHREAEVDVAVEELEEDVDVEEDVDDELEVEQEVHVERHPARARAAHV